MIAKLNKELTEALKASSDGQLEIVDPETQQTYYLVNSDTHRRAMEALRRQQDLDAIAQGLAEIDEGKGTPIDESFSNLRSRLGFPAT